MKIRLNTIENIKNFVDMANSLKCEILIKEGKYVVSGKSIMGIFSLNVLNDLEIEIYEDVNDERDLLITYLKKNNLLLYQGGE